MRRKQSAPRRIVRPTPARLQNLPNNLLRHVAVHANNQTRARMEVTSQRLRAAAQEVVLEHDPAVEASASMFREIAQATKTAVANNKSPLSVLRPGMRRKHWTLAAGITPSLFMAGLYDPEDFPALSYNILQFEFDHHNRHYIWEITVEIDSNYRASVGGTRMLERVGFQDLHVFFNPGKPKLKAEWALLRGLRRYNANPVAPPAA